MKALFFAEGGSGVGLGHLRRCSSLADAMTRRGWDCEFISMDAGVRSWLTSKGCRLALVKDVASGAGNLPDADYASDIFVVDSYKVSNQEILLKARPSTRLIVAFDDMFNRHESADVIISTGVLAPKQSWPGRPHLARLLGPTFHPLPAEYLPLTARALKSEVQNVLITLGGLGHFDVLETAIQAVCNIFPQVSIDCVVGPFAESEMELKDAPKLRWHRDPTSLKPFLLADDLAVAGSGQTLFELAVTGMPGIAVGLAENQRENLMGMEEAGTVLSAGWSGAVDFESVLMERLIRMKDAALRRKLSESGQRLIDGCGAFRIVEAIEKLLSKQKVAPGTRRDTGEILEL